MQFDILTIFPEIFASYLNESILKRAQENGSITVNVHDIRAFSKDKHGKVDDIPYGGGPGMVMTPQPLYDAITAIRKKNKGPVIYLSPKGELLTQAKAETMAKKWRAAATKNPKKV